MDVTPSHPSFVTKQELNIILASESNNPTPIQGRIISAVIPHHLLAGRIITNVMKLLAIQKPNLVIVVGPNHPNSGNRIITGYDHWQTPEGIMNTDVSVVQFLLEKHLAVADEKVLSKEHSVGALVPLLHHYLPEAKVVPIILHHDVSLQEVDVLVNALGPFLDENTVLISSVDFSHYLTRSEAQAKDRETIAHMRNFNYVTLFRLGNDYLDSPASLSAAFLLAEKHGLKEFNLLDNTNSGIILQNDFTETTSYFTLVFNL